MGNSLRCCLACILPCGALDVVRVVHLNGHVEEFARPVTAGEVMASNPDHILTKPCSQGAAARRILIVSPDATLRRGSIYFLIPESPSLQERRRRRRKKRAQRPTKPCRKAVVVDTSAAVVTNASVSAEVTDDQSFLTEFPSSGKMPGHRQRRSGTTRVATWQPRLESITEDL